MVIEEIHVSNPAVTVSYKPLIDYKRHFDSFVELGVGGLSKQINELYQRAFASRSKFYWLIFLSSPVLISVSRNTTMYSVFSAN